MIYLLFLKYSTYWFVLIWPDQFDGKVSICIRATFSSLITLTYLINAQDGISEYGGQNFLFNTWKKGFYYIEINEQGGQKLKNQ